MCYGNSHFNSAPSYCQVTMANKQMALPGLPSPAPNLRAVPSMQEAESNLCRKAMRVIEVHQRLIKLLLERVYKLEVDVTILRAQLKKEDDHV